MKFVVDDDDDEFNQLGTNIHYMSENCRKVFKVRGQRSRSCERYNGGGIHFEGVESRFNCLN